jgi:hypothetical protein
MAQNDLVISNQSFPSFRSDLNSALQAINTSQSGTSRPSGAVAGTIWLDTTGTPTANTLKFFDGTDDISLATINYTANTVDWLDSTVSITGLTTTATGTVLTLSNSDVTSTVNLIIDNDKEIRFREATTNGVNYVSLSAPASLSANLTFTLPSADGTSGQFLKTDGAGNLSFSSLSFATPLAVVGDATAGASIRLPEDTDNGSNYVAIKAPDNLASNLTLTLPSADGTSGQVLQTNGSGVLSFAGVSASAGQVIQVVTATDSTVRQTTSSSFVTASNTLSVSITPSSASNKILIMVNCGQMYHNNSNQISHLTIYRGATDLGSNGNGLTGGNTYPASDYGFPTYMAVYDSPNTTSSTTYQVYIRTSTGTINLNESGRKATIIAMEVKG